MPPFHCISSTFGFIKLSMKFLLHDFGQFHVLLISVISVDSYGEGKTPNITVTYYLTTKTGSWLLIVDFEFVEY
jgi:hypothetical protein